MSEVRSESGLHGHRALSDAICAYGLAEYIRNYLEKNDIEPKNFFPNRSHLSAKDVVRISECINPNSQFYNRQVVFTGILHSMQRKDAMQKVINIGGTCGDNVSKKTNFLVLGDYSGVKSVKGKSTKHKAAEKLILKGADLQIIDETLFLELLNED